MRKGSAMEGFIREDGTIRPIEHYDDTELRGKIQTNTANISNLNSRVTELEEHGGVEDPTKADKVEDATAGNLASLDENGNLQDSGKKPADFALVGHTHNVILDASTESSISIDEGIISIVIEGEGSGGETEINGDNISNLNRALTTPSSAPENDATKLITSKAVYDALAKKMPYYDGAVIIKHKDDTVAYPFAGDDDVRNSVTSLYSSIPANTYVLCRVTLDNSDYSGTQTDIVTVHAFAYVTEGQELDDWSVDIIFANGIKFTAGRQGETVAASWTKTTYGFFS